MGGGKDPSYQVDDVTVEPDLVRPRCARPDRVAADQCPGHTGAASLDVSQCAPGTADEGPEDQRQEAPASIAKMQSRATTVPTDRGRRPRLSRSRRGWTATVSTRARTSGPMMSE